MPNPRIQKQARDALTRYVARKCDFKQPRPINAGRFIRFIAEETRWNLVSHEVDGLSHDGLRGMILKKESTRDALLLVTKSNVNNKCWRRFTVVKEISHLYLNLDAHIDCDDALTMLESVLDMGHLTSNFVFTKDDISEFAKLAGFDLTEDEIQAAVSQANPHGVAEISAVAAAIEVLIPPCYAGWLRECSIEKNMSLMEMAKELMVPAYYLELRLREWNIHPKSSRCYRDSVKRRSPYLKPELLD